MPDHMIFSRMPNALETTGGAYMVVVGKHFPISACGGVVVEIPTYPLKFIFLSPLPTSTKPIVL